MGSVGLQEPQVFILDLGYNIYLYNMFIHVPQGSALAYFYYHLLPFNTSTHNVFYIIKYIMG